MAMTTPVTAALGEAFRAEERTATRISTLAAAVVALVAMPAWAILDHVLVPGEAGGFLRVRLLVEVVILASIVALRRDGRTWSPERVAFIILTAIEGGIAWMLPRTGEHLELYVLGLSLPVYASGFMVVARWQLTAASLGVVAAAAALSSASAAHPLDSGDAAAVAFYIGTAGALAIAAQLYRRGTSWQRFVALAALEEERQQTAALVAELDRLSRHDALTGVGNRRMWQEEVTAELRRARRTGRPLSLIVCDLDHFKHVNDRFGHLAGDEALRRVADVLIHRMRSTDVVARVGGDEFAVLCPDTPLSVAAQLANELADLARAAQRATKAPVTISFGVAEAELGDGEEQLLHRADRALYAAKATRDTVGIAGSGLPAPTADGHPAPAQP